MDNRVIVTEDSRQAGGVVYWELTGPLDLKRLAAAWAVHGLDQALLPDDPSVETALRRAVQDLTGPRTLARRIARGHWALVEESVVADTELEHRVVLTVKLLDDGTLEASDPVAHTALNIQSFFDGYRSRLEPSDVGGWLVRLANKLNAVSLRSSGGFYFLPPDALAEFGKYATALESVSEHRVRRIPAMRSQEAVAAVLAGLTAEAEGEAQRLEEDLANGTLGKRGLGTRVGAAEAMKRKLCFYEELLGVNLEGLRNELERLRASLAAATLMAMDDQEAAA